MREDEEKKQAFDEAKKAAQEKAKALEDMQKQLAQERERAEREATQRLEEERQRMAQAKSTEQAKTRQEESGMLEQIRKELFEAKKENARLQGQLDTKSNEAGAEVSTADYDALRAELQDLRREKVRLEVEMTTCKSAEEFTAIAEEARHLLNPKQVSPGELMDYLPPLKQDLDQKIISSRVGNCCFENSLPEQLQI